jgi:aconitate hydratase
VPAVVDLAAMRDGIKGSVATRRRSTRCQPVDLVIDHSVHGRRIRHPRASRSTSTSNTSATCERYVFLRWGQKAFNNFRVVPPGTGICHQVNLEYLAADRLDRQGPERRNGRLPRHAGRHRLHTTMINGLGVLGWGVGGIEAEAAMLGQPVSMLIPEVIGFKLTGKLPKAPPPPTWCSPSPRCCASTAWSASSSSSTAKAWTTCRSPTAPPSPTWPRIRRHLRLLPDRRRDAALPAPDRPPRRNRIALVEAYAKAQGHVAQR